MDTETREKLEGMSGPTSKLQHYLLYLRGITDPDGYEEVRGAVEGIVDAAVDEARRERLKDERIEALEEKVTALEQRVKNANKPLPEPPGIHARRD